MSKTRATATATITTTILDSATGVERAPRIPHIIGQASALHSAILNALPEEWGPNGELPAAVQRALAQQEYWRQRVRAIDALVQTPLHQL